MDESPHKCTVCNRSFNQRSNLKTHLLTHTDHKPYECGTCGKVFRRNCDLRRHALTHTIGGDMPTDTTETFYKNTNDTSENDERNDDGIIEDDIEVDSPVHSPINIQRHTPTPDAETKKFNETEEIVDVSKRIRVKRNSEACENSEPPQKIPRLDEKDEAGTLAITHCHHNGDQHYTMRPGTEGSPSDMNRNAKISESYSITLHVRRDLHYKNEMIPSVHMASSSSASTNLLSTIPFRKRSIEFNHDQIKDEKSSIPHQMPLYASPLNLSNHIQTSDDGAIGG